MPTAITNNVKITVETAYQNIKFGKRGSEHMFAYRITIVNKGEYTIKLLRRHWFVIDPIGGNSEIEGEGVVGQTPVLEPGESHQYISGCSIQAEIGKMYGTYLMERQFDGKQFKVAIPEFYLIAPYLLN
jgi:ApaG protein